MKRLCFGAYLDILLIGCTGNITKKIFTNTIIQTIDPDSNFDDKRADQALNQIYTCKGNISPSYSNIRQLAPNMDRELVYERFEKSIMPLLNKDKLPACVYALCHLIEEDRTLHSEQTGEVTAQFESYVGNYGTDIEDGNFSHFLASVFLFTVIEVKNTVGRKWLESVKGKHEDYFEKYVQEFGRKPSLGLLESIDAEGVQQTGDEKVEPAVEPSQLDGNLKPEQIEIAPPQNEGEQDSLSIGSEKDDCSDPELLPSDIEQEAEHELAEVHEEEKELKVPAVTSPYSLCENFMRIVKTHAYSIDLFLNRSTEDVGRTEFEEIIPAAQDFIELQTELKSMDENTGCPKAVKEFTRRFCKYYTFFKDSYLDYLCHTDETFTVLDNLNLDIFLEQANGLRKAAGKRYSAAKSTALAVISKHDAENEQT